jgi:hypothetical protein
MLEAIRTFMGKIRGLRGERQTVVEEGMLWRCTKCHLIFITNSAGAQHQCQDQKVK